MKLNSLSLNLRRIKGKAIITLRAKLSGAVYCYRSCLWACLQRVGGPAGGVRTLLQPARAQCLRLCECFFHFELSSDHFCMLMMICTVISLYYAYASIGRRH